jgi:hypothetical protein
MEDNNYTFEQMRADYQALKDNLSKQEIINDRLLREAMRSKVGSIRSRTIISVICAVFVILIAPFAFHYNPDIQASWAFIIVTDVLMSFCIFMDWKFMHKVQSADLSSCDLLTFSKDVKKLKEDYKGWIKWGILLAIFWVGWLSLETWFNANEPKLAIAMIIGLFFGLCLGGFFGYQMNKKVISLCDEIISNLES